MLFHQCITFCVFQCLDCSLTSGGWIRLGAPTRPLCRHRCANSVWSSRKLVLQRSVISNNIPIHMHFRSILPLPQQPPKKPSSSYNRPPSPLHHPHTPLLNRSIIPTQPDLLFHSPLLSTLKSPTTLFPNFPTTLINRQQSLITTPINTTITKNTIHPHTTATDATRLTGSPYNRTLKFVSRRQYDPCASVVNVGDAVVILNVRQ
ncbi:hypothetical protein BCR33DRAFT_367418 [Rhizoclosmatium globosum]|uniref:SH3 domain-containing protein n=1 Tax=Rhizoclosmatium globosum TaxID=329046 RepID=A0A1Y2C0I1_9FUNG|nr:hypothetical protein BCR33DRAFT_367418 [Rhizoclosmatium globosum]|eukprot:ORY40519.1 hypothetical protein BCR33DRAFT_367418 [Rhizoclosmatium globosum]